MERDMWDMCQQPIFIDETLQEEEECYYIVEQINTPLAHVFIRHFKLLETIIRDRMMDFLIKHKLINPSQHGFLKARSCLIHLLCVLEELT